MSAIGNGTDDWEPINVLFALYENIDALDFTGPLEILSYSQHDIKDANTKAFEPTFVASTEHTMANQGCSFRAHINYKEAHKRLSEFDVLVVPGGSGALEVIKNKAEPLDLISAFAELQKKDPARERTVLSICTGSLLLAQAGLLQGMAATTHPDYYTRLSNLCKEASAKDLGERTDVMEERYVVNNARFDIGDDLEDNPYVFTRKARRNSIINPRKGSQSYRESITRRESIAKRSQMKLGGLRVITSGGITTGLDAALYLVSAMVNHNSAQEVARVMQYKWNKGVVVDSIDV